MRRALGWSTLAAAVATAVVLADGASPVVRMLAMIAALFFPLKALVLIESGVRLPTADALAFCLWPGMRAEPFARRGPPQGGAGALVRRGAVRLGQGTALVLCSRALAPWSKPAALVALLPGLSLMLHFGAFNLLAGYHRWRGRDVDTLFDAPLHARTLDEFWSRRWNRAFSEFTARVVYRPLSGVLGRGGALVVAFLTSGLAHEAAISWPVRAGYGGPMAYFALHAALVWGERTRGWRPGVWLPVFAPLPLLFHPAFLDGVLWPWILGG